MRGRLHTGWVLVTLLPLALSCHDADRPKATPPFRNPGLPIVVRIGEEFTIEADHNATVAPAYRRELVKPLPDAVMYLREDQAPSDSQDRKAGAGGTKCWVFKAVRPGSGKLVFASSVKSEDPDLSGRLEFSVTVLAP